VYGFQWRHFGAKYRSMHDNYDNEVSSNPDDFNTTLIIELTGD